MSNTGRWSLAALVVVIALVVALWPRGSHDDQGAQGTGAVGSSTAAPVDEHAIAQARADAGLAPCPAPAAGAAATKGPLTGITLDCLADGKPADLAAAVDGKPTLLNLWAYWCAPCATELPYLQQFSARAGSAINVLTVHSDSDEKSGLERLADLKVKLPGFEDGDGRVRMAVGAPPVLPVSVLIRPDGTVAQVLAQPFGSVDEIADAVRRDLGVIA